MSGRRSIAAIAIVVLIVGGAGVVLFRKRRLHVGVTAPRVYTCDEVGPEQRALGDATARNFQAHSRRRD